MLRSLIVALTLLHLGPGLAFALLAFGCGDWPGALGAVCSRDVLGAFGTLTLGAWMVLGAGWLALQAVVRLRGRRSGRTSLHQAADPS